MKRIILAVAITLAVVLVLGFFIFNRFVTNQAEKELNAILKPKFEATGTQYADLKVVPANGTITLYNVVSGSNGTTLGGSNFEATVGSISFQSSIEDLIAAAKGVPEYLHGLDIMVKDVTIVDGNGTVNLESISVDLDGLIDVQTLSGEPAKWLEELMDQDEVAINMMLTALDLKNGSATRRMGLPTETVNITSSKAQIKKDGDVFSVNVKLDSKEFGSIDVDLVGNEEELSSLSMSVQDLSYLVDDGMSMRVGQGAIELNGLLPVGDLMEYNYEELMTEKAAVSWSVTLKDFILEGDELEGAMLPNDRMSISLLNHNFSLSKRKLISTLDFNSNAGDGNIRADLDIESNDPPVIDVLEFNMQLDDVHDALGDIARSLPITLVPRGDAGYEYSYSGPLLDLEGLNP